MNTQPTAHWIDAAPVDDIALGSLTTIKKEGKQLVLVRDQEGTFFALDNKCPHEGYALAQGDLKGNKLTCCWHNWKFDIASGACLLGGEGVRSYATRQQDGRVEVDIADPDPETLYPDLLTSLEEGLFKHENDRAVRDGIRLLQLGYSPWELLAKIGHYDALHGEYGTTHALPVAADCGRLLHRLPGVEAMYAIAQAMDVCGDGCVRLPPRTRPLPRPKGTLDEIRRLAEKEDAESAEALLLGAFDEGVSRQDIEEWLHVIFSDHFTGFGHPLIYLVKAKELLDQVEDHWARDIYASLLHRYILATREDTLPYMAIYRKHMEAVEEDLAKLFEGVDADAHFNAKEFRDLVLDAPPQEASLALVGALSRGVGAERISRAMVAAGAERMRRFDPAVENDPTVAETWVWVTHRFTHASAVHKIIERHPGPDSIRYLFHALAFTNSGKRMDVATNEKEVPDVVTGEIGDLAAAISSHDANRAQGLALHLLQSNEGFHDLRQLLETLSVEDAVIRPIVVAHLIKTSAAAIETFEDFEGHLGRETGILALIRFLALGIKERRIHDMVTSSIGWVVDGKIPRKLTQ